METFGVRQEQIIAWGRSIGSVGATAIAKTFDVRCCILQSPVASALDVVWEDYNCDCVNIFKNYKNVKKIHASVLIIHGEEDGVVPVRNSFKIV